MTLKGPEATAALGAQLGLALRPGDVVGLIGGLGAGKTQLVRGAALSLGVPADEISSPTYSLVQSYAGRGVMLHHLDLYRLATEADLHAIGYFELIEGQGAVLVEWLNQVPGAAPVDWLEIQLARVDESTRALTALAHGPSSEALLTRWWALAEKGATPR